LLRALRNHSLGSLGSRSLGGIHFLALSQRGSNYVAYLVFQVFDVLGCNGEYVHRDRHSEETPANVSGEPTAVLDAGF
jgi:hypothetical protein